MTTSRSCWPYSLAMLKRQRIAWPGISAMRRKEFWQISFEKERRTFDNPDLKRDFCRGRFIGLPWHSRYPNYFVNQHYRGGAPLTFERTARPGKPVHETPSEN